jgi:MFS family permease
MNDNKNIWMMGWVSFFTDLASAMIKPMIPVYVVVVLNQGVDKLGIVVAVTTFVSFFLRWLGGWLSDHYGRSKPFLILGYGLSGLVKPLFGFAGSWQMVATISASERLGKALRAAPKDKLISASGHENKQGRAFGIHKTLDISGEALGALVAFMMLFLLGQDEYWIRQIFFWTIIPTLLGMLVLIFLVQEKVDPAASSCVDLKGEVAAETLSPLLKLKLFLFFCASFLMVSESFMLLRAHEAHITLAFLPLLAMAGSLTQAFLSYYFGKSADDQGDETVLIWGISAGLISLIFLALGQNMMVAAGFVFQGIFMVATLNALRMRLGKFKQSKGSKYGWFYAVNAIVTAIGALVTGWLWDRLGGTETLSLLALSYFLVLVLYAILRKRYSIIQRRNQSQ